MFDAIKALFRRKSAAGKGFSRMVEIAPNFQPIAAANNNVVSVWDYPKGIHEWQLYGHKSAINRIAFSSDSKQLVTVGADGEVLFWDVDRMLKSVAIATETTKPAPREQTRSK